MLFGFCGATSNTYTIKYGFKILEILILGVCGFGKIQEQRRCPFNMAITHDVYNVFFDGIHEALFYGPSSGLQFYDCA